MIANVQATMTSGSSLLARHDQTNLYHHSKLSTPSFPKRAALEHVLAVHRGGESATGDSSNNNNNNNADMSDEDIDEYIDFLLAYAEDRAVETDNPLFKNVAAKVEEADAQTVTAEVTAEEISSSSESDSVE